MARMITTVVLVAALIYVGLCAVLFFSQRALIYFPQPRSLGASEAAQTFEVDGVALQLTVRPHAGPGAVLYFGGNGEDVSASLPALVAAYPGREIVMLHYRGYGGSAGRPSEAAIAGDARALFDRVHALHPDVVVIGRSLGSGVAVRLASERPVAALVLVTPYDSLQALAQAQFRFFPVRWLLLDKFESWRYAPKVHSPTLIVVAEHDEVIPRASTERLAARFAPGVASAVTIRGALHNTLSDDPAYVRALAGIATLNFR
jgi:pimeloyl-ACP methyl ester carboxylesterase